MTRQLAQPGEKIKPVKDTTLKCADCGQWYNIARAHTAKCPGRSPNPFDEKPYRWPFQDWDTQVPPKMRRRTLEKATMVYPDKPVFPIGRTLKIFVAAFAPAYLAAALFMGFWGWPVAVAALLAGGLAVVRNLAILIEDSEAYVGCPAHPKPGTARVKPEWLDKCNCSNLTPEQTEECALAKAHKEFMEDDDPVLEFAVDRLEQKVERILKESD